MVKNPPVNAGDPRDLIHSSILAWKVPWTEEADELTVHGVAKSQ